MANTDYSPERLVTSIRLMLGRRLAGAGGHRLRDGRRADPGAEQPAHPGRVLRRRHAAPEHHQHPRRLPRRHGQARRRTCTASAIGAWATSATTPRSGPSTSASRRCATRPARYPGLEVETATDADTLEGGRAGRPGAARARSPRPTALVCVNDVMAVGALRELRARGLRVPEDVSVTGFDNVTLAQFAVPALTTVAHPARADRPHHLRLPDARRRRRASASSSSNPSSSSGTPPARRRAERSRRRTGCRCKRLRSRRRRRLRQCRAVDRRDLKAHTLSPHRLTGSATTARALRAHGPHACAGASRVMPFARLFSGRRAVPALAVVLASLAAAARRHQSRARADRADRRCRRRPGAKIDRNIFGQFAEHLGNGIYEGVWVGPDSPIPNTRGIRNDVVAALKALKVPNVRWPGGCFADEYHWRNGIGPPAQRPRHAQPELGRRHRAEHVRHARVHGLRRADRRRGLPLGQRRLGHAAGSGRLARVPDHRAADGAGEGARRQRAPGALQDRRTSASATRTGTAAATCRPSTTCSQLHDLQPLRAQLQSGAAAGRAAGC